MAHNVLGNWRLG